MKSNFASIGVVIIAASQCCCGRTAHSVANEAIQALTVPLAVSFHLFVESVFFFYEFKVVIMNERRENLSRRGFVIRSEDEAFHMASKSNRFDVGRTITTAEGRQQPTSIE